jgi:hypothetical protein
VQVFGNQQGDPDAAGANAGLVTHTKAIFTEAVDLPPAERRKLLDARCAGQSRLRADVEALLAAHDGASDFLDDPTIRPDRLTRADGAGGANSPDSPSAFADPTLPRQLGPYRIERLMGEGGFGSVYVAEQERPIRRTVALKLIKPGIDTRQVIARFEAERQALAMMDPPNIARVFDAGATDAGLPYFVMELVDGVPITRFCDGARLPLRGRLEVFLQVCQAVQHAHQKGIIHRDIRTPTRGATSTHSACCCTS